VLAGRNLDLGIGSNNPDGTGLGITTIGNTRNPFLGSVGANIIAAAGFSGPASLGTADYDFDTFLESFYESSGYAEENPDAAAPGALDAEGRARLALDVFFTVLRNAGRDFAKDPSTAYSDAYAAIAALFPEASGGGDVLTRGRDIRTKSGGDVFLLAPGGGVRLADSVIGTPLAPPGIITEAGGKISIFANEDVSLGIGRIFTLRGGSQVIWSTTGDIAAGSSPKTVASAPPTRVLIDPQSAAVQTDLAGLATGGGIGVLATVAGVQPGDVDLIAPVGTVDAGDAGIRATGSLVIAASQVLNADNISVAGSTTGVPVAPPVAVPNTTGLSSAAATSGATAAAAQDLANTMRPTPRTPEPADSSINVEVLGYGGTEEDNEEVGDG
jgi:hypothetical protein